MATTPTTAFSWLIEPEEKIDVMTEDGVSIAIFSNKTAEDAGALDVAPRFRYIVRIATLPQEDFATAAARLLFASALLALPHTTKDGLVTAVVLTTLNQKCVRIAHGPHVGREAGEPRAQTSWTVQANRHHFRSPTRPRCFSASEP